MSPLSKITTYLTLIKFYYYRSFCDIIFSDIQQEEDYMVFVKYKYQMNYWSPGFWIFCFLNAFKFFRLKFVKGEKLKNHLEEPLEKEIKIDYFHTLNDSIKILDLKLRLYGIKND